MSRQKSLSLSWFRRQKPTPAVWVRRADLRAGCDFALLMTEHRMLPPDLAAHHRYVGVVRPGEWLVYRTDIHKFEVVYSNATMNVLYPECRPQGPWTGGREAEA